MDIVGLAAVIMTFSVPLTALGGWIYIKSKKINAASGLSDEEKKHLLSLKAENAQLKNRLENLEAIVSEIDVVALRTLSSRNDLK